MVSITFCSARPFPCRANKIYYSPVCSPAFLVLTASGQSDRVYFSFFLPLFFPCLAISSRPENESRRRGGHPSCDARWERDGGEQSGGTEGLPLAGPPVSPRERAEIGLACDKIALTFRELPCRKIRLNFPGLWPSSGDLSGHCCLHSWDWQRTPDRIQWFPG